MNFPSSPDIVENWVARSRVKEMLRRGWRAVGPIREDAVLMSGPDLDDDMPPPVALGEALPAVMRLRLAHAAAVAERVRDRRQVA